MKGAPGVIDELVSKDVNSFPREDPAVLAARAKQMVEDDKIRKEEERRRKQEEKEEAAQVKKLAASNKPAAQPVAKDPKRQAAEREMKAMKIRLYFRHLPHKIGFKEPKVLPSDDAGLDSLLLSIEAELQSAGGVDIASNMFIGFFGTLEAVTQHYNPLNLHLSGPAASLAGTVQANKKQWEEMVTEFAISNAEWFLVSLVASPSPLRSFFVGWARQASSRVHGADDQHSGQRQQGCAN